MAERETTALFGGSFDPVHLGHLAVARDVVERFGIAKLWFVPAKISPLKGRTMEASDADRLEMLRLALGGDPRFGISDCELRRAGISFTVDTLREWKAARPERDLVFVAGMDSLLTLSRWREYREILRLCRFVTFARPGYASHPSPDELGMERELAERLVADIIVGRQYDVSSTEIKSRAAAGRNLNGLVPEGVARYIAEKGLYRP